MSVTRESSEPCVGEASLVLLQGLETSDSSPVYGAVTGTRYVVKDVMYVDTRDVPSILNSGKVVRDLVVAAGLK